MINFITSYQRPNRLLSLLKELDGTTIVLDDGSDYDPAEHKQYCRYYRYPHQGKQQFWRLWDEMLRMAKESTEDEFLFLQDDVENVQVDEIKSVTEGLNEYGFNIMRRGSPLRGWTQVRPKPTTLNGVDCFKCGYVDCIFATNRQSLAKLNFKMEPIPPYRKQGVSSGVGEQLSQRFVKAGVPMYFPEESLAFHGDHESKMHPNRKVNHMISQ